MTVYQSLLMETSSMDWAYTALYGVPSVPGISVIFTGGLLRWDAYLYRMIRTPAHHLLCLPAPAALPFVTILCHLCANTEKKPRKRLIAVQRGKSCLSLQKT